MSAVLKEQPAELGSVRPGIPPALVQVVERCLEKQSDNRFQSSNDLAFALSQYHLVLSLRRSSVDRPCQDRHSRLGCPGNSVTAWVDELAIQSRAPAELSALPKGASIPSNDTQKSLAVLPFLNLSADKADDYLSDGMTEELLNALARIKGLHVPGRSSSFAFKGKSEDNIYRKVGEQLHVGAVLEGSVRKAGEKLRITARVVKVADGDQLWSETYDRDMTNIFAIQSDIAARVAEALKVQLFGPAAARKNPTENLEAYKLYLQGRQLWNRRTGVAITTAIHCFNQAIASDPTFALAYSGLADAYVTLSDYSGIPQREAAPKARAAALQAIQLDESLGEPHAALGLTKAYLDWDWLGGEAEIRRALELNPNYATGHHWLGATLQSQGKFSEGLAELRRAEEIDPLSPVIQETIAELLFQTGQAQLAIDHLKKQITLDPGFAVAHYNLGLLYLQLGRFSEAIPKLGPCCTYSSGEI